MRFQERCRWAQDSFHDETYPNHVTIFSTSPRKKCSISHGASSTRAQECWLGVYGSRCFHNRLLWAHMQIPIGESLGGGGRLWFASLGWSPPLSTASLHPYRQQIHNNDIACGAMDTRFKGPEAISYNPYPTTEGPAAMAEEGGIGNRGNSPKGRWENWYPDSSSPSLQVPAHIPQKQEA